MLEGGQMAGHVRHPCAKAAGNLQMSNTFLTTRDGGWEFPRIPLNADLPWTPLRSPRTRICIRASMTTSHGSARGPAVRAHPSLRLPIFPSVVLVGAAWMVGRQELGPCNRTGPKLAGYLALPSTPVPGCAGSPVGEPPCLQA